VSLAATVLIPTHDHGPTLLRSVPSALAQTVSDLEVLVIGDGAPDETRELMAELCAADERVRYFDHPKGERHGETYRHEALQEARGEIVCYLSDDDVWLPEHVEEMRALLAGSDLAHTLSFSIDVDDRLHVMRLDFAREYFRSLLLGGESRIHLSVTGHTMELYRRLPGGWRATPQGTPTDLYFWQRLLSLPDVRAASGTRPTVLHFPSSIREGWSIEERLRELDRWRLDDVAGGLPQQLLDVAQRDRAALDEALAGRDGEVAALGAEIAETERARAAAEARAAGLQTELDAIARSTTWRLRGLLVGLPGLRAVAKVLGRLAAPAAAARRGRGRRPEQ
jgi:glycosyl transferase family 2